MNKIAYLLFGVIVFLSQSTNAETLQQGYQPAIYNNTEAQVEGITVKVNNKPYLVSLSFQPNNGTFYVNSIDLLDASPEHFNANFNIETQIVALHSVQVNDKYVSAELVFDGDSFTLSEVKESSLQLFEKGSIFSFFNRNEWSYVGIPSICVPSNCSQSISATIAGSSSYSFKKYKIKAIGKPFIVSTVDILTSSSSITGFVDGLQEGQVIYPGEEIVFDLKGYKTGGRSGTFQYIISVDGMGDVLINTFTGSICC